MKPLTTEQAAYIAGLIDGDGCISTRYHPSSNRWRVRIDVWQIDPRPLTCMKDVVEGSLLYFRAKPNNKLSNTPIWHWTVVDKVLDYYLPQFMPYLIVKKDKAEIALQFRARIGKTGQRVTPEERAARMSLVKLASNRK